MKLEDQRNARGAFLDIDRDAPAPWDMQINPHMGCNHVWKPVQLIFSTVYNCAICGCDKEKCD